MEPLVDDAAGTSEDQPVDLLIASETYSKIYGKWSASDLESIVACQPDFQAQRSRLEEAVEGRHHLARFLPKFHCELNFTELYWCITKQETRRRADLSWFGLQESMWNVFGQPDSLGPAAKEGKEPKKYEADNSVSVLAPLFLQKASRKTREFFRVYLDNEDKTDFDPNVLRQAKKMARQTRFPRHVAPRL